MKRLAIISLLAVALLLSSCNVNCRFTGSAWACWVPDPCTALPSNVVCK